MRRLLLIPTLVLLTALLAPGLARAADEPWEYRLENADITLSKTQAGAHADLTTSFQLSETSGGIAYGTTRDVIVRLPPGVAGNPAAFSQCTPLQMGILPADSKCPQDAQIGSADIKLGGIATIADEPIYNMPTVGGDMVARFGFFAGPFPAFINVRLDPETNTLVAGAEGASPFIAVVAVSVTFWGIPSDPLHDTERITPNEAFGGEKPPVGGRKSTQPSTPFMTNPTSCEPRTANITVRSYQLPDAPISKVLPFPQITGCGAVDFTPTTKLALTTSQGTSGTGLDYELNTPSLGLQVQNLNASSHLRRAEVVLPQGVTVNPSQAEGLGVCSEGDLAREAYNSLPNVGCPDSSKIGSVVAESPVIDRKAEGALYVAKPYENPFGTLLALYMVLKIPDRGVLIKVPGKVTLDPVSGQITTVFDDLPQLPVSNFKLHFREGARAPLVSPPACGSYEALSKFGPWSDLVGSVIKTNSFVIQSGPDHGPCPTGGLPPFHPGLLAGSLTNRAGAFTEFDVRLSRTDAEQELTHFSLKLPPGLTAKLAGIPYCSDLAIAAAAGRKGIHGGEEELTSSSCPAASAIGRTLVGAGVGQVLTYVPGKLYLAGPYNGAPLSVVAITAAKAGPFDLGTVVVREALRVNPETAEVFIDAAGSDPIPHIINGVPVHLRDIRVYVDRPGFALNPTDCSPTSVASTVLGSGLDFTSEADDRPLTVSTRFQAADCAALTFRPKLRLSLKGGTKRSANPAFRAELRMRPGEANITKTQVTLPHSEFLDNSHIGTICTRPVFNEGPTPGANCPKASIYGYARAFTPLLDQPLEGPVFLRANGGERELPDLVAALNGQQINVALVGYIDSVDGRIRNTFQSVPDAPVSKFVLSMFGGKKGLLVNSTNLCLGTHRAKALFDAQNGKRLKFGPPLEANCPGKRGGKKR